MIATLSAGWMLALTACGPKEGTPAAPEPPVSEETAAAPGTTPGGSSSPGPGVAATLQADPTAPRESLAVPWARKEPVEKIKLMEHWLLNHAEGDAATKQRIVREVQAARLTPADRALLEETRQRYDLPKIPF